MFAIFLKPKMAKGEPKPEPSSCPGGLWAGVAATPIYEQVEFLSSVCCLRGGWRWGDFRADCFRIFDEAAFWRSGERCAYHTELNYAQPPRIPNPEHIPFYWLAKCVSGSGNLWGNLIMEIRGIPPPEHRSKSLMITIYLFMPTAWNHNLPFQFSPVSEIDFMPFWLFSWKINICLSVLQFVFIDQTDESAIRL